MVLHRNALNKESCGIKNLAQLSSSGIDMGQVATVKILKESKVETPQNLSIVEIPSVNRLI